MDNKTQQLLISNIDSAIEQLNSVKLLLNSQLNESEPTVTISGADTTNPFVNPKDVLKVDETIDKINTYCIEEETTSGWTLADKTAQGLSKEDAKIMIDALINDGSLPDRIRVVVDGQR